MTLVKDIRKTVTDTTPVYAVVGVTDLAVERLRDARSHATAVRLDLDISAMQHKAVKRFEKVTEQAQQIPAQFRNQTFEAAGRARETYSGLAIRGEKLVKRIRNQKSTKDLFAQAGSTMSLGKGAVTTVRKAAHETQHAAKATLATGRHEAEVVIEAVAASVHHDARATAGTVRKSAGVTRTSAKRTATRARKSTAAPEHVTRSAATSAAKT